MITIRTLFHLTKSPTFVSLLRYRCLHFGTVSSVLKKSPLLQTKSNIQLSLVSCREYAKSKDKKKEKGKGKVEINESQLAEVVNVGALKDQMQKAADQLKAEFINQLSLRTSAGSIEGLTVEFEGKDHTLQELAQITRKNPKTIVVNMAIFPQAIPSVLKTIANSGMNLNPQQEGTTLFITVPKVTTEHRENLAKSAKALFVKCKSSIRDVQQRQIKAIKRKEKISEDVVRDCEKQIIALADNFISESERILASKQKELLGKE